MAAAPALSGSQLAPYFDATVDASEEAVVDALFTATTTTGAAGRTITALPLDRVRAVMGLS